MKKTILMLFVLSLICSFASALSVGEEVKDEKGAWKELENGGYANLRMEGNNMALYFLDEEKKVIAPEWPEAITRITSVVDNDIDNEVILLNSNGTKLTSPRFIEPPINYFVHVLLKKKDKDGEEQKKSLGRLRLRD